MERLIHRRCRPDIEALDRRELPSGGSVADRASAPPLNTPATAFAAILTPTRLVTTPNPATAIVTLGFSRDGHTLNVEGRLKKVQNVNAVDLVTSPSLGAQDGNRVVAVLIAPGAGSRPRLRGDFRTAVKSNNLVGPLAFHSLRDLARKMRAGEIDVVVYTSSFPLSATNPATSLGELRGTVKTPPGHP